jgi:Protein of unknown function (DUF3073)
MGRGRAKAKQTKVARQLKYSSGGTDLERLAAELAAERGTGDVGAPNVDGSSDGATDEVDDEYDDYEDAYGEEDDE